MCIVHSLCVYVCVCHVDCAQCWILRKNRNFFDFCFFSGSILNGYAFPILYIVRFFLSIHTHIYVCVYTYFSGFVRASIFYSDNDTHVLHMYCASENREIKWKRAIKFAAFYNLVLVFVCAASFFYCFFFSLSHTMFKFFSVRFLPSFYFHHCPVCICV